HYTRRGAAGGIHIPREVHLDAVADPVALSKLRLARERAVRCDRVALDATQTRAQIDVVLVRRQRDAIRRSTQLALIEHLVQLVILQIPDTRGIELLERTLGAIAQPEVRIREEHRAGARQHQIVGPVEPFALEATCNDSALPVLLEPQDGA